MKTFYIIANSDKEESIRLAEQAKQYLADMYAGKTITVQTDDAEQQ